MMNIVVFLLISSFVGTIIWIMQNSMKPVTHKFFSQTWHYYTGLIPVFFLLGGSEILIRLIPVLRSVLPDPVPIPESGTVAEQDVHAASIVRLAPNRSLMEQLLDNPLRLDHIKEYVWLATGIWAVGAAVFLVVNFHRYWVFKRTLLQESWVFDSMQCPVKVITSSKATTPMVMGLWKPMVVLPDIPFRDKELAMILSHELIHMKRGDLLVKLLVLVANAVHWFNPAAYTLNRQINTLCELSCDEKVVQGMDMENRRFYGETLLSVLEYGVMRRNVIFTSGLCNPKKDMKRRLINLMNEKKMKKPMLVLSLVAAIVLVGSGGAVANAAGSVVPSKSAPTKSAPTKSSPPKAAASNKIQGSNVTVKFADGTMIAYDKEGNVVPAKPKGSDLPEKLTQKEIVERIKKHLDKGFLVPQAYIDELPQKELDALNEAYDVILKKSK